MVQNKNVSSTLYIVLCNLKPKKKRKKNRQRLWTDPSDESEAKEQQTHEKDLDSLLGKCKINNNDTSRGRFVLELMQI